MTLALDTITCADALAFARGLPAGSVDCVVYDPFMGSGTTALVARRLNRRFIGSELNPEYVALANQRLAKPFAVDMLEVR